MNPSVKQFRDACNEAELTPQQRYEASEALHDYKATTGSREHMNYGELLAWVREWKEEWQR
jgi:hypothetical protein